jgi:hypothetical protein
LDKSPRRHRQTRKSLARIPRHKSRAEKGAKFKSLHDPWCDTSTPQGELLVTILAGFATFERHLIKARTDDGRKRAKARGVRFGRPRKLDQHQRREALQRGRVNAAAPLSTKGLWSRPIVVGSTPKVRAASTRVSPLANQAGRVHSLSRLEEPVPGLIEGRTAGRIAPGHYRT